MGEPKWWPRIAGGCSVSSGTSSYERWLISRNVDASKKIFVAIGIWSSRQGCNLAGESPAVSVARVGHVVMPHPGMGIGPEEVHLYKSSDHKQDFLDCIRLRTDPIAHVEIGHRSASICHLGNIAMLTGRKLRWDPDDESFVNNPEANRMLSRSMRSPWRL